MQFTLNVISVDITTKTNKAGKPYQVAALAFRNVNSGKVEEKKILDWTAEGKACYSTAAAAQAGQVYTVTMEKGEQYWNWKSMVQESPHFKNVETSPNTSRNVGQTTGARTYETAEERAERQVLIVRQSSLSSAVATLTAGAKAPPKTDDVLNLAEQYSSFVFQKEAKNAMFSTDSFDDIPNDL